MVGTFRQFDERALMDFSIELDPEDLWQDTLDLLEQEGLPEFILAMLRSCTPTGVDENTLHVVTPMRLVLKTVSKNSDLLEKCLSAAAFQDGMHLDLALAEKDGKAPQKTTPSSQMTPDEIARWKNATSQTPAAAPAATQPAAPQYRERRIDAQMLDESTIEGTVKEASLRKQRNPLVETIPEEDSKLTFDRFVCGDENDMAYNAALQVANGSKNYNPLFIHGKSGLGKTHLLRAIQNYIATNDPTRICVYKDASSFINDYTSAMGAHDLSVTEALKKNYEDIDVLIIDDVQKLAGKVGTITFFFDTFNVLKSNGKQIVLAADRTPAQLGMGKDAFDERVTTRLASGFPVGVQVPNYELKLRLIETFCERLCRDSQEEHVGVGCSPVSAEAWEYMAKRAGSSIRLIEGFCQRCLLAQNRAEMDGRELTFEEIDEIAKETWPTSGIVISIEDVQKAVEKFYDISHDALIGESRHKGLMEPRHVAIWLSRELCSKTLADIGDHFGGRSHATVKNSLKVVDDKKKEDKIFYDRVMRLKDSITAEA